MTTNTSNSAAHHARSLLFVPATRPARFAKALDSGADCIIIDLEDAVAETHKSLARDELALQLPMFSPAQLARTIVRVNAVATAWHSADLHMLKTWVARGVAVMLPKAEMAHHVDGVADKLGNKACIVALIESLAGLDCADDLARDPSVVRLAFGHLDFQLDLGMHASEDERELAFARNALVMASRRAGLPAPIDGVTVDIGNTVGLASDALRSRAFGFGGKLCIHPDQVAGVNNAFGYTEAEQAWALRVLEEAALHGGEAFSLDGHMVDLPVIRAAQAIMGQVQS